MSRIDLILIRAKYSAIGSIIQHVKLETVIVKEEGLRIINKVYLDYCRYLLNYEYKPSGETCYHTKFEPGK